VPSTPKRDARHGCPQSLAWPFHRSRNKLNRRISTHVRFSHIGLARVAVHGFMERRNRARGSANKFTSDFLQPILSMLVFGPGLAVGLRALSPIVGVGGIDEVHFSLQGNNLGFVHGLGPSNISAIRPKLSGTPLGGANPLEDFRLPKSCLDCQTPLPKTMKNSQEAGWQAQPGRSCSRHSKPVPPSLAFDCSAVVAR
jgi:hypothetical protein